LNSDALSTAASAKKIVVLTIGALRLMLPQDDIRTVESITDVQTGDRPMRGAGWVTYLGQAWPVYCFSDELVFLSDIPHTRRACVMLAFEGAYCGLLCDDARVFFDFSHQNFDIPASMQLAGSPLSGLIHYEEGLACVSDATHINKYVALATLTQEQKVH
jgi:hypothetical protein